MIWLVPKEINQYSKFLETLITSWGPNFGLVFRWTVSKQDALYINERHCSVHVSFFMGFHWKSIYLIKLSIRALEIIKPVEENCFEKNVADENCGHFCLEKHFKEII